MTPDQVSRAHELLRDRRHLREFIASLQGAKDIRVSLPSPVIGHPVNVWLSAANHPRVLGSARAEAESQIAEIDAGLRELGVDPSADAKGATPC